MEIEEKRGYRNTKDLAHHKSTGIGSNINQLVKLAPSRTREVQQWFDGRDTKDHELLGRHLLNTIRNERMIGRIGYGESCQEMLKVCLRQGGNVHNSAWEQCTPRDIIAKSSSVAYSISRDSAMPPKNTLCPYYPEPSARGAPR